MEKLLELHRHAVGAHVGTKIVCGCGATHQTGIERVLVGEDAKDGFESAMRLLAPSLASVLVITDATVREKTCRYFEKEIARFGYRVRTHTLCVRPAATLLVARGIEVPEGTHAVVGIGGGAVCDVAKYVAAKHNLCYGLVTLSPACIGACVPSAMLQADGIEETYRTPPPRFVLCDPFFRKDLPHNLLAAALGELASKAVALYDYLFAARLNRERFCLHLLQACGDVLDETLIQLSHRGNAYAVQILTEGSLRFSIYAALMGNSRLLSGGETQIAHALCALMRQEQRPDLFRGELEMLAARAASALYQSTLAARLGVFVPPPDNNRRLNAAVEFLGLGDKAVMRKLRPLQAAEPLKLAVYRLDEFRAELSDMAARTTLRVQKAFGLFKRLYADDGYQITRTIEQSDLALCVALAPDLKEKYTMLSYMKDKGLLENLLMQF